MVFGWIIVLIVAMVSTRATNKLKRTKRTQEEGEYISVDESETESEDWDKVLEETAALAAAAEKGKAPVSTKAKTPPTAAERGKAPMQPTPMSMKRKSVAKKRGRARGIEINEPLASEPPPQDFVHINTDRMKAFENRECIGERHVNIGNLRDRSATFGRLIDRIGMSPICNFPESTGYCIHLVRTFYLCANNLQDNEGGPMEFRTTVRNTHLTITPQLIGEVIGIKARLDGTHYMKSPIFTTALWRVVVDGICMPDTSSTGNSVFSKELRPEYRFLNFIVCYNILPNMQTKVLRWDRMLFLYLLGHPTAAEDMNINIPYIIWNRMARYVEHPHQTERLPFPMIVMQILRKFDVDIRSSSYMHSLGTINDTTVVKLLPKKPDDTPTPPRGKRSSAPVATAATTATTAAAAASTSEDDASVTSIYREQQRLSSEQERMSKEITQISSDMAKVTATQVDIKRKFKSFAKLVKKIFTKLGCSDSDDTDSD